jgi:hypothetical protein
VDDDEIQRTEEAIRDEAQRVALALADFPQFALDLRDELGRTLGETLDASSLDDLFAIGSVDDYQSDPGSADYRRMRRLGELKIALDGLRGPQFPSRR